jgi:hypothetical protein
VSKEKKIELGCVAREKITGFKGVVIGHVRWLTNCDRFVLQPRDLKEDGTRQDSSSFDVGTLEWAEDAIDVRVHPVARSKVPVDLGDEVMDNVTGIRGIVYAQTTWLEGCVTCDVQPKGLDKDGQPFKRIGFDERSLLLVKRASPTPEPVKTGGPRPETRRAR